MKLLLQTLHILITTNQLLKIRSKLSLRILHRYSPPVTTYNGLVASA